jgi:hypothetical protein
MLNAKLGERTGFDRRFGEQFGRWVERQQQGSRDTVIRPGVL